MIWIPISIIALLFIIVLVIIYFFNMAFVRGKITNILERKPHNSEFEGYYDEIRKGIEWFDKADKESVYITSHDGLKLHAYLIRCENADKTIILVHGYRSIAQNDFSCAMKYYYSLGMNIILIDQRSHGKSEGRLITFGIKESQDVKAWIDFAKNEFSGTKIFLSGLSMGSTTVLMASSFVDGVSGIIADCGFTSPKEIIALVAKNRFKLPKWFCAPVGLFAKIFGGFDYSYSAEQALSKTNIPILFIHGDEDDFVPSYMTEQNFDACVSKKKKIIVKNATHGFSFLVEPDTVKGALESFILNNGD